MQPANPFSSPHRLALPSGFVLEKYRILKVLGEGGFAITYLAATGNPQCEVAIKEMFPKEIATRLEGYKVGPCRPVDAEKFVWAKQRFIEEAGMLERLNHPNIVRTERYFELMDTAYLVMQVIRGQNFRDWMRANQQPTEGQLKAIILPLLDGLEYVHRQGFLHRDISPENVMITKEGRPILLDFGSTRAALGRRKLTSVVRPGFSPIEQYQSVTEQGPYTDIYALAGVVIQTITRKEPPQAIDRCGARDPFGPLSKRFGNRYSPDFLRAFDAGFAVRPQDRPQNVAAWRQMILKSDWPPTKDRPQLAPKSVATPQPRVAAKLEICDQAKVAREAKVTLKPPTGGLRWSAGAIALAASLTAGVTLLIWPHRSDPKDKLDAARRGQPNGGLSPTLGALISPSVVIPENATTEHSFKNSLGMKFVPVVRTKNNIILFCIHQTRREDYSAIQKLPDELSNAEILKSNPPDCPVVLITQRDAREFCEQLSRKEDRTYRLPTMEEWDQAFGPIEYSWPPLKNGKPLGNYLDESGFKSLRSKISGLTDFIQNYDDGFATVAPVMKFPPNAKGLFDLGGNVEEWCEDEKDGRVFRKGASWMDSERANIPTPKVPRDGDPDTTRLSTIGFRCVLVTSIPEPKQ